MTLRGLSSPRRYKQRARERNYLTPERRQKMYVTAVLGAYHSVRSAENTFIREHTEATRHNQNRTWHLIGWEYIPVTVKELTEDDSDSGVH
jgi:hypothetical protein